MKEDAYKILKTAIEEHREQLLVSRQTCLGILRDYGGKDHPEVELIADAVGEKIPLQLLRSKPVTQEIICKLANSFSSRKLYDNEAANFVVGIWADALGLFDFTSGIVSNSRGKTKIPASKKYNGDSNLLRKVSIKAIRGHTVKSKRIVIDNQIYDYHHISEEDEIKMYSEKNITPKECSVCKFPVIESKQNALFVFISGMLLPITLCLWWLIFSGWWILLGLFIFAFIYLMCLVIMSEKDDFLEELRCPRCHTTYKKAK
jgi:ssDNA-binding Zn-finger/Zn-ribbon topoisomerase 1